MAGFSDFYNDPTIRFDHTPVIAKFAFQVNHVGAHDYDSISVATFTPTDANSIFVSDTTGNDTTGTGTSALPYKTILKGIDQTTALKTYVIIQDSVLYVEDISSATTTYFQGMYAASGQTPTFTTRLLGYTPADANSIFFDKTGNDGSAGTQAAPKLTIAGAVAATDGTHQAIVCQDSETYTEPAIEFTGNFLGMYAADGFKPTFIPTPTSDSSDYSDLTEVVAPTIFESGNTEYTSVALLSNGNWVCTYADAGSTNGKFVIYDEDGVQVVAPTIFESGRTAWIDVALLDNGNWVCVYRDAGSTNGKFVIYDEDGVQVVAPTLFEAGDVGWASVALLDNTNWVCTYRDVSANNGKFVIYDEDGVQVVAPTIFEAGDAAYIGVALLSNTNWVCTYKDLGSTDGRFVIYDEDGVQVVAPTQFDAGNTDYTSVALLSNGNWVCTYGFVGSGPGKFVIYDEDGVQVVAPTQFEAGNVEWTSVALLNNGGWVCTYQDVSSTDGKFVIYDEDGVQVVAPTQFEAGNTGYTSVALLSNGNWVCTYADASASNGKFVIYYPYSWSGIKISDTSEINGWLLDGNDSYQLNKIIEINGSKLTTKWCDLFDCTNPTTDSIKGYAINGDNEIDVYNSKIYDNDGGVYLTANVDDCIIDDSHFYRNNGTWAIQVDGAAAGSGDITIEHNDIFQNYAGIYLENNHGTNEILKNNIIHNNSNEGVKATTAATITYTVRTDDNDNVSDGTDVFFSNPLYVNEGAVSEALIDLNIKTLIVGYPTDSPAKGQADDSRNCGSYDVRYIGSITTWTSIEIDKPLRGNIDVDYDPVGGHLNIASDGTPTYSKKGQTVGLKLTYVGTKNAEFLLVLTMWASNDSTVRVFPDPTTNPDTYETMVMVREKLKGSAKNYKLTRTGKEGVVLAFLRKFEI